ncbi:MAG: hypothetical protein FWE01_02000 [Firmicutes bacterium]|nr:hypothetical protein [Bacillota bacterium]
MKDKAYALLHDLNIEYVKHEHEPAFTCADSNRCLGNDFDGLDAKSLFIRNKNKSQFYLVLVPIHKQVDLKGLQETLKETRMSFGSDDDLMEKLRACRGSVSLLNLASVEKPKVIVLVDDDFSSANKTAFHPNDNMETVVFNASEIARILDHVKVEWRTVKL